MKKLIAIIAAFFIPSAAFALEVDTSRYFAYYKIPDRSSGAMYITSPYIFLSKEKCSAKGVHSSVEAWKSLSISPLSEEKTQQCWTSLKYTKTIVTCVINGDENGQISNSCVEISESRFLDTRSLPSAARF